MVTGDPVDLNWTVTFLTQDTGLNYEDLRTAMSDRELWRNYVDSGAPD